MKFYIGLHEPAHAWPFLNVMISITRLRRRKSDFRVNNWLMDSGAFSEISRYGRWRLEPERYAEEINRWKGCGSLLAAVTQDMMCEPFMLQKSGLCLEQHQEITIERYLRIAGATDQYIMPVLQGFEPSDYVRHLQMWGSMLTHRQWCGVGSVCQRNGDPLAIAEVLMAIQSVRPDLKLHGFGLKLTALKSPQVRALLASSDSMAWSLARRNEDMQPNDPRDGLRYCAKIHAMIGEPVHPLSWWLPMKVCRQCGVPRSILDFHREGKGRRKSKCKYCISGENKKPSKAKAAAQ